MALIGRAVGFKFANAFLLQFPYINAVSWEYMYPLSAASPPFGSMIVLMYYVYFVYDRPGNSISSNDNDDPPTILAIISDVEA